MIQMMSLMVMCTTSYTLFTGEIIDTRIVMRLVENKMQYMELKTAGIDVIWA